MLGETKNSSSIRKSAKLPKLNVQQQIENQEIADRMNRKITFARNPRHLNQTMSYVEASNTNGLQTKFRIEPQQLFFSNYDTHHIYESEVKLINNSKYIQRIKITPLKQKQFVLSNIKYPKEDSGDIAPGMAVVISIRFRPVNLNDYQDELIVIVGDGVVKIPIVAQRERCEINWPKSIACGHCWVGDIIKKEIILKNKGGDASFALLNADSSSQNIYNIGYFKVTPATINFQKQSQQRIAVEFMPQTQGVFKQKIKYKSFQGDLDEVEIVLEGGAYSAQILLEQLNGEKIIEQRVNYEMHVNKTELGKEATAKMKIKNLAVVQVDYFWHFQANDLKLDHIKGKMKPSQLLQFNLILKPKQKIPETFRLQLYLFNLPEKSLMGNVVSKNINGIQAIQCLSVDLKTKPLLSNIQIFPLHRQIVQPIYENCSVNQWIKISNNSNVKRTFKIEKIRQDQGLSATITQLDGVLEPNSSKEVLINFNLLQLTSNNKKAYFLASFDNSLSQIFSIQGKSTNPQIVFKEQVLYYGLCKTFTLNKKKLVLKNPQKTIVEFKIHNENRFYIPQFYDFYEFEDQSSYKRRFNIYNPITGQEVIDWFSVSPETEVQLDCYLNTMEEQSIQLEIKIDVKHGKTTSMLIIAETQDVLMQMSREQINMKQIYKGNIYNSNKFLSKQLQIVNLSNHDSAFQISPPQFQYCQLRIQPLRGIIKKKSTQRIDLFLEPIKTGEFNINIDWKYYDDFKANSEAYTNLQQFIRFNSIDGSKSLFKFNSLSLKGVIKGMAMNYYIKDQSRAKKIRVKIEDLPQSVKMSSSSFNVSAKSSKNLFQNEKLVYPMLEQLNFYNCQINQVRQVQIIVQNDSGLTTQYEIYAEQFRTLQKSNSFEKKSHKGLVKVQDQPFTSDMGKTFIKNRALDKSQKIHLGNNKGISILCQPSEGILNKKQNQKVLITMFNDTSGRFIDNLIINVKNHQRKKIPIDIHIKGTPVSLSRNQLGIDFNQEIPFMNLGTILHSNGLVKRSIKVINNGPKQVELKWLIYPYNKIDKDRDLFSIQFNEGAPGSNNLVDLKWNAIKPNIDQQSNLSLEPKQKIIKGRQEFVFNVLIQQIKTIGQFSNLLICQPHLVDGNIRTPMESLAVVVKTQTIDPFLTMDLKHKNHINKLQKFAIAHEQYQTNSNNSQRKLKLKNNLNCNLTFDISIVSKDNKYESFKLIDTKTNSPATTFTGTVKNIQKSFVLTQESILEVGIQLCAHSNNINQWPMEQKIRKDGQIIISYSNGGKQVIDLVGWLYRPWIKVQMPNELFFSSQNFQIDFGTVHVKNSKKSAFYLINPSKVDGKFTIAYIKYHQSIKYKFQQSLWTSLDHEDQTIKDEKQCWKLSVDGGTVKNKTIPVHYMPGTLALPSEDDKFAQTHKPVQIVIMFKPQSNSLYKSKFRISVVEGPTFDLVVKGRGSYEQELQKK